MNVSQRVLYKHYHRRSEEVDPDSSVPDVARQLGSLVVAVAFVVFGGVFHPFSEGLTEVFLYPPGYLGGTRVWTGTVDHTPLSERATDTTYVGVPKSEGACLPVFTVFSMGGSPRQIRLDRSPSA